ncbi:MAG: DUF4389 domain-containing protein [Alphaproteobacteria bacterium]|nr:DUF4389 domain-containing protein [Alphaproteobacteria bacterium]
MNALNEQELKKHVKDKDTWLRFIFLVVFGIIAYFCSFVILFASAIQFLAKLLGGSSLTVLSEFGDNLAAYLAQVIRYMTFASDEKPFPFAPFPSKKA